MRKILKIKIRMKTWQLFVSRNKIFHKKEITKIRDVPSEGGILIAKDKVLKFLVRDAPFDDEEISSNVFFFNMSELLYQYPIDYEVVTYFQEHLRCLFFRISRIKSPEFKMKICSIGIVNVLFVMNVKEKFLFPSDR